MGSSLFMLYFVFALLVILGVFLKSLKNFSGRRELSSGFECGFDGKSISRVPFSIRFFLILILFLVFDVEISLALQFPFLGLSGWGYFFLCLNSFLLVLLLGTVDEWRRGFLQWF